MDFDEFEETPTYINYEDTLEEDTRYHDGYDTSDFDSEDEE